MVFVNKWIFITDIGTLNSNPVKPAGLIFLTNLARLGVSSIITVWVNKLAARRQLFFPTFKDNLNQKNAGSFLKNI